MCTPTFVREGGGNPCEGQANGAPAFATRHVERTVWLVVSGVWAVLGGCASDHPNGQGTPDTPQEARVLLDDLLTEPWTVGSTPSVQVGGGGPHGPLFHRLDRAIWLSDGSFLVADAGDAIIHRFGSQGQPLMTLGGMGFGPGELRGIRGVIQLEDGSILAYDPGRPGLTRWSEDGSLLKVVRLEPPDDPSVSVETYAIVGQLADGHFVLTPEAAPGAREGELILADSDSGRIEFWPGPAGPLRVLEVTAPKRPLTPDIKDEWINKRLSQVRDPGVRRDFRRWLERIPFPDSFPHFSGLAVDRDGRIWLRDGSLIDGSGPAGWVALGSDGSPVAQLTIPSGLKLEDVWGGQVLGVYTDSLGVQTVGVYPLHR